MMCKINLIINTLKRFLKKLVTLKRIQFLKYFKKKERELDESIWDQSFQPTLWHSSDVEIADESHSAG